MFNLKRFPKMVRNTYTQHHNLKVYFNPKLFYQFNLVPSKMKLFASIMIPNRPSSVKACHLLMDAVNLLEGGEGDKNEIVTFLDKSQYFKSYKGQTGKKTKMLEAMCDSLLPFWWE